MCKYLLDVILIFYVKVMVVCMGIEKMEVCMELLDGLMGCLVYV